MVNGYNACGMVKEKMKYTRRLDALRNILKNKASYLSVMLIAFLGVAAFLSMDYSSYSLRHAGSDAYNKMKFRDLEIISPLMLTTEDYEAIKETSGVFDAEPVYLAAAVAETAEDHRSIQVLSLTERINKAEIIEGRLPEGKNECLIEKRLAEELGLGTGDSLIIKEYLPQQNYTITGIALHPNHTNPSSAEDPYVLVNPEAFDSESLKGLLMAVEVAIEKDSNQYRFDSAYEKAVSEVKEKLNKLAGENYTKRYNLVKSEFDEKLEEYIKTAENEGLIAEGLTASNCIPILRAAFEKGKIPEKYRELIQSLLDEYDRLASLKEESWVVNDVKSSTDYVSMIIDCDNISKLEMTFSFMFIIVGAMVIYASISKMIDEQRDQVGGMKAFGLHSGEVFSKYLLFGVSASLGGMLLGALAARFGFCSYVLSGYSRYYTFDIEMPKMAALPTLIVLFIGTALSVLSCYLACRKLLRQPAVILLSPKVPQVKLTKVHGKGPVFSLYGRLILRNMRTDIKRIAVTVAGVAGCCALIVTGFSLRSAVGGCLEKQYGEIVKFDEKTKINSEEAIHEIERILDESGTSYISLCETYISYRMGNDTVGRLLCGDLSRIKEFYHICDWKTGRELSLLDDGIYIQRRIAEIYSLKCGDEISIMTQDLQNFKVRVAGIFENYIGNMVLMNETTAKSLFPGKTEPNVFLVRLNGADKKVLSEKLEKTEGFESMESADSERTIFESATSVVNAVILMLVFMAAMMAAVVLTNLTNMYMLEKKRELTIMRINGFTVSETIGYMIRETILTTAIGIVLGCGIGSAAAYHIIHSLEQPYTRMNREISLGAWLIGAAITLVFTAVVNYVVLRKVKNLRLSDI